MRSFSSLLKWHPPLAILILLTAACHIHDSEANQFSRPPLDYSSAASKKKNNFMRDRLTAGFAPLKKEQRNSIGITASSKQSLVSLPMAACSRKLRQERSLQGHPNKTKNMKRKSYSLHNHHSVNSVVLRQTKYDNDTQDTPKINNMRGGASRSNKKDLTLPSSIRLEDTDALNSPVERLRYKLNQIDVQDAAVILAYGCTQFAVSLPVILIPMIAADPFAPGATNSINSAAFLGSLVSLSALGAGAGKVVNGFICQAIGGRLSGSLYLLSLAIFSTILSTTYTIHGYAIAGMEFSASMLWTASSVLMVERYATNEKKAAAGITNLSLASTSGTILAKVIGGALLSQYHWRQVCLLSFFVAAAGSGLLYFVRKENVKDPDLEINGAIALAPNSKLQSSPKPKLTFKSIRTTLSRVLGDKMFFVIGFAHFGSFIVRSSDKIIGAFLADSTELPRYICGTLTTSVTLGFVLGLVSGRKFEALKSIGEKKAFVFKKYAGAVLAAVGIALCANQTVGNMLGHYGLAAAITLLTGVTAACVGYQFYQLPPKYSTTFGEDKPVYISFNDGLCFLLLSPFWSTMTSIVASSPHGWSICWLIVAAFIAAGGSVMTKSLDIVVGADKKG